LFTTTSKDDILATEPKDIVKRFGLSTS